MSRGKNANEHFQDEYAKEAGRQRAREDAERRKAETTLGRNSPQPERSVLPVVLVLAIGFLVVVLGCIGIVAMIALSAPLNTEERQPVASTSESSPYERAPTLPKPKPSDSKPATFPASTSLPTTATTKPPETTVNKQAYAVVPPKNGSAFLGTSQLVASDGPKYPELKAKWLKEGVLIELKTEVEVELIKDDPYWPQVSYGGKTYSVAKDRLTKK